jgi:lipopolysaccharide/colanic/teichoic acid biosynthesis glycosyltransferase
MSILEMERSGVPKQAPLLDREKVLQCGQKYWFWRRLQDIVLSVLAVAVLWPLMLLVSLIIIIDSPGAGPIFTQTRIGRDGKPFKFYKFRSMCPNAEEKLEQLLKYNEMDGPAFKMKDDPRITRVGRIIRRTSIDELPQLWNVIRGEMSIVGPRPGIPREVEQYDDYARQRLLVTPGLTCYWQIQPYRNRLSFDEWVALDVKYIQERSFRTDWKIILATFGAVLGMNGE